MVVVAALRLRRRPTAALRAPGPRSGPEAPVLGTLGLLALPKQALGRSLKVRLGPAEEDTSTAAPTLARTPSAAPLAAVVGWSGRLAAAPVAALQAALAGMPIASRAVVRIREAAVALAVADKWKATAATERSSQTPRRTTQQMRWDMTIVAVAAAVVARTCLPCRHPLVVGGRRKLAEVPAAGQKRTELVVALQQLRRRRTKAAALEGLEPEKSRYERFCEAIHRFIFVLGTWLYLRRKFAVA